MLRGRADPVIISITSGGKGWEQQNNDESCDASVTPGGHIDFSGRAAENFRGNKQAPPPNLQHDHDLKLGCRVPEGNSKPC